MHFLAAATLDTATAFGGDQGFSWWQTAGGLVLVFGLLVVCLKLLGRFQARTTQEQAALLTVWNLGARREIQVLRLQDEVHYLYRHDGAMVVLKQIPLADWERQASDPSVSRAGMGDLLSRILPGARPMERGATCDLEA